MRLVHVGKGKVLKFDDVARPAWPNEGKSSIALKLDPAKFRAKRELDAVPQSKEGNNYKPGSLLELGGDQCRYTINAHGLMCGKRGFPWCETHQKNVLQRHQR